MRQVGDNDANFPMGSLLLKYEILYCCRVSADARMGRGARGSAVATKDVEDGGRQEDAARRIA